MTYGLPSCAGDHIAPGSLRIVCRRKGIESWNLSTKQALVAGGMKPTKLRKPSKSLIGTLAGNIRRLRRQRSLSQEALADICGLHRTYVGSVERGERNVTLSSLELLAKALDVPVVDLLAPEDE